MSEAHTKGPWHIAAHTAETPDSILPGCDWSVYGSDEKRTSVCFEGAWTECAAANARLIAAAPDLLAALVALVNHKDDLMPPRLWDAARAAIARAEGDAV